VIHRRIVTPQQTLASVNIIEGVLRSALEGDKVVLEAMERLIAHIKPATDQKSVEDQG